MSDNTSAVSALLAAIGDLSEQHSQKTAEASEISARVLSEQANLTRVNNERSALVARINSLQTTIDTLAPPEPDPEAGE